MFDSLDLKFCLDAEHETRKTKVEEVPQNMFCIPSAEENIIMEMPQKIRI